MERVSTKNQRRKFSLQEKPGILNDTLVCNYGVRKGVSTSGPFGPSGKARLDYEKYNNLLKWS